MVEKEKLANGDEVWRTERGEARVHVHATSVVEIVVKGYSTMELIPLFVGEPMKRMRHGIRVDWFGDYSEMTGYDTETRVALSEFTTKYKTQLSTVTVLVRSKIVAMGATVANLAVGGILDVVSNREKYERAIAHAVARGKPAGLAMP